MGLPDADIYPSATGKAAEIVKQHEDVKAALTLYSGWFCPFVQRAWIVLEEKKLPYSYKEINPYHKDGYLKINPRGLVPTLGVKKQNGEQGLLIESKIICEYLDEAHPSPVPLLPQDPFEKAKMNVSVDYVTSRIIPAFHRFLQHTEEKPYSLEEARQEFLKTLLTFIADADPTGPFFAGSEFTFPDVILAPWAVRLWVFDHYKGGLGIPAEGEGGEDEKGWARWRKWATAVENRPSVVNTLSDKEHYLPLYQRYADDIAQSELAKATRAGRGVP